VQAAALAAAAKYGAANHERRQTKCNGLADTLIEANPVAELEIEKAAAEGKRRAFDLGPVRYLASHPPSIKRCCGALSSVATGLKSRVPR
jgi:hypothetical protein